jgi:protein involved in polysaccharide export with SLBB domain
VNSPGVYQIEDAPSLLKLLTLAGGLAANHGSTAFVLRRVKTESADTGPAYTIHQVRIDEALSADSDKNEALEPGDIVNIPNSAVFFISGDAIRSGSYAFKEGMTLLQALANADTLKQITGGEKVIIVRQESSTGQRQEIDVDLDALTSGKEKDTPLLPNDVIIISKPNGRTIPPFLDAPPKHMSNPCRGPSPCIARLE